MFKFRPICLRNMRISNMLLKKSALAGLTLAQIITIMCRDPYDEDESPSPLEKMVTKAENMYITIWVRKPTPHTEVRQPSRPLLKEESSPVPSSPEETKELSKSVSPPVTPFKSGYQMTTEDEVAKNLESEFMMIGLPPTNISPKRN